MKIKFALYTLVMSGLCVSFNIAKASQHFETELDKLSDQFSIRSSSANNTEIVSSVKNISKIRKRDDIEEYTSSDESSSDSEENEIASWEKNSFNQLSSTIDIESDNIELNKYILNQMSFEDYFEKATAVQSCLEYYNSLIDCLNQINDKAHSRLSEKKNTKRRKFEELENISKLKIKIPELKQEINDYTSTKIKNLNNQTNETNIEKIITFNKGLINLMYNNNVYNFYWIHFCRVNENLANITTKYINLQRQIDAQNNALHNAN